MAVLTHIERIARKGHMPPLLRRCEAETYQVIEGEILFYIGGSAVSAGPGDVVVAPPDVPRTFRVGSSEARWVVLTQVRSLERFTDFGRAVSPPLEDHAEDWPSPDERDAVAAIGAANGIELLGPPGALPD